MSPLPLFPLTDLRAYLKPCEEPRRDPLWVNLVERPTEMGLELRTRAEYDRGGCSETFVGRTVRCKLVVPLLPFTTAVTTAIATAIFAISTVPPAVPAAVPASVAASGVV